MATETIAPALEAAPETPETPAGEITPQATETSNAGETPIGQVFDMAELQRRLKATEEPPASETIEEPEAEPEKPETAAPATEKPTEEEEETFDPDKPLPKNFRFHTEDQQRAQFYRLLKQNPDADPIALARKAGYELPAGEAKPAETAKPEAEAAVDHHKALRDEIAAIETEIETAETDFQPTGKLAAKLAKKMSELARAEVKAEYEAKFKERDDRDNEREQAAFNADNAEAKKAATDLHPATKQKGSEQFEAVETLLGSMPAEFFTDPQYPLKAIEILQKKFPSLFPVKGAAAAAPVKPGSPAKPAPAAPAAVKKPAAPSRPVGETVPGSTGGPRTTTVEEAVKAVRDLSAQELLKQAHLLGTHAGDVIH